VYGLQPTFLYSSAPFRNSTFQLWPEMSYTLLKNSEGNAPSQGELGNHDSPSFWETFWRRNRGWKVAVLATVVILPWIANMLLFGLIYLHLYPEKELLRPRRADNAGFPQITYCMTQWSFFLCKSEI
jgi:hypothetical protein